MPEFSTEVVVMMLEMMAFSVIVFFLLPGPFVALISWMRWARVNRAEVKH